MNEEELMRLDESEEQGETTVNDPERWNDKTSSELNKHSEDEAYFLEQAQNRDDAAAIIAKQEEEGSEAQNKLLEAGKTQLDISNTKNENAEAHLNLAAIAAMQYDWNLANEHINKAADLDLTYAEGRYNMAKGTISIPLGDYENAINHLNKVGQRGWAKWRKGIVQLMSGNIDEAKKEMAALRKQFEESGWKENGGIDYIHAIISARDGDSNAVAENLKTALSKDEDGWLKERLVNDVEFLNYSDAVQSAMN